jgi:hypothetical protein
MKEGENRFHNRLVILSRTLGYANERFGPFSIQQNPWTAVTCISKLPSQQVGKVR